MRKIAVVFQDYCRREPLFMGIFLYVLLTFAPSLAEFSSFWLMCAAWFLLPSLAAVAVAAACFDAPWPTLKWESFAKSLLWSAPVVFFCAINVLTGEFTPDKSAIPAVLSGISEEFLCRLLLYSALLLHFRGREKKEQKAVLLASVLFGIAHLSNLGTGVDVPDVLFQCCYTTVIGFIFANSYRRSGCIWGSVVWHMLLNLSGRVFC